MKGKFRMDSGVLCCEWRAAALELKPLRLPRAPNATSKIDFEDTTPSFRVWGTQDACVINFEKCVMRARASLNMQACVLVRL